MKKNLYFAILLFLPYFLMAQKTGIKSSAAKPALTYWSLRGNSNINDTINFLGTTDKHRLFFRVNNKPAGFIDYDSFQRNTTYGYQTLVNLTQYGFDNTAIGYQAMYNSTDGHANIALGVRTLYNNTQGSNNTAIGNGSLFSNTTGVYNVAIGGAMTSNTEGLYNIAIGDGTLTRNETGRDNIAIGSSALYFSSASENTAVGYFGMYNNTTGTYNTASGYLASFSNTVGNNNTAYGSYALYGNVSGNDNTAVGNNALYTNQTGRRITTVGSGADVTDVNFRNSTAIGYNAKVDASNKVQVGNMNVKSIGGMVGWTNYSDARIKQDIKENVPGLSFIKQLKPVTYHLNPVKANELLGKKDSLTKAGESNIDKILFTGLLAQDVEAAAKKINYDFSGVDKTGKIMGLRYSEFVVPLVKAVQELNAKNDSLQARLDKIEAMLNQSSATTAFSASSSISALSATTLSLYPNPANNNLVIQFNAKSQSAATIMITDMKGSTTLQQSFNVVAGNNNMNIDISGLAKGAYTLQVQTAGTMLAKKFVKE